MNGLSVIIPSKNATNFVACAVAVRRHEPTISIHLMDDGMSLDWLPRPDLMPCLAHNCQQPFIFARNCNYGIEEAGTDDVILLNDDALLQTPAGFTAMQKAAEDHPEYGLIAATCNNVGNPNQWPKGTGGLRDENRMVCFVCVLIPRKTIELVGLLDERFTGYGLDDDDYSLRVRKAGLKIGVFDGCHVDHGSLTSTFRGPAGAGGNFLPNMKLFIEKWGVDNWGKSKAQSDFRNLFPA